MPLKKKIDSPFRKPKIRARARANRRSGAQDDSARPRSGARGQRCPRNVQAALDYDDILDRLLGDPQKLAAVLCSVFDCGALDLLREDPFEAMSLVVPDVRIELVERLNAQKTALSKRLHEVLGHRRAASEQPSPQSVHRPSRARTTKSPYRRRRTRNRAAGRRGWPALRGEDRRRVRRSRAHPRQRRTTSSRAAHRRKHRTSQISSATSASQAHAEACCVRMAQRMRGTGYVVLAEGDTISSARPWVARTACRGAQCSPTAA